MGDDNLVTLFSLMFIMWKISSVSVWFSITIWIADILRLATEAMLIVEKRALPLVLGSISWRDRPSPSPSKESLPHKESEAAIAVAQLDSFFSMGMKKISWRPPLQNPEE